MSQPKIREDYGELPLHTKMSILLPKRVHISDKYKDFIQKKQTLIHWWWKCKTMHFRKHFKNKVRSHFQGFFFHKNPCNLLFPNNMNKS